MAKYSKIIFLLVYITMSNLIAGGLPANAFVSGSEWYCNSGYKKQGNECISIFD